MFLARVIAVIAVGETQTPKKYGHQNEEGHKEKAQYYGQNNMNFETWRRVYVISLVEATFCVVRSVISNGR